MTIALVILHVIVSLGLILVVLLQTGKGAEVGAVFGGSSATIFGSSGAGNFLTRLTTGMAIVFMATSLMLGWVTARKPAATIFDSRTPATEQRTLPQSPSAAPTPTAPSTQESAAPEKAQSEKPATE
jgi:preprotein translocase subunit SecG